MYPEIRRYVFDLVEGFPTLPAVATRVMAITADAESSTEELFNVVQADQVMSANVLRMANSVFYGVPKRVGSLKHALSILGYTEIRNLVITQVIFNSFKHLEKETAMDLGPFWTHAFSCALAAKPVGRRSGVHGRDYYLPCLVHDIGKLLIYMALPDAYAELVKEVAPAGQKIFELEERLFGMTHAEVARRLLARWMLPESIVHAVGSHHNPDGAGDYTLDAWVVHVVDLLVHWHDLEESGETVAARDVLRLLLRPEVVTGLNAVSNWTVAELALLKAELADLKERQRSLLSLFLK